MTIFLLLVVALCFYKLRLPRPVLTGLNEHYLDFDRTTAMKGIFILLVFLTHVVGYIPAYLGPALLHEPYFWVQEKMEQGVVVMFLFYSGYGVMESIKKKGTAYVRAMPKNRVLRTLLHFDLAVLLYIALDAALGTLQDYSLREILLSFTGWEAVGNSNWYIFAVLVLYLATVLSFAVFGSRGKYIPAACAVTALAGVYIAVLFDIKGAWWYDTVLLYPLGLWFSLARPAIDRALQKHKWLWYVLFVLCTAIFLYVHYRRRDAFAFYVLKYLFMGLVVVFATMKLDVCNPILIFFGKHLFEMYILMRIPMLILQRLGVTNVYLFVFLSFAATVLLAVGFKKLTGAIDKPLFAAKPAARPPAAL